MKVNFSILFFILINYTSLAQNEEKVVTAQTSNVTIGGACGMSICPNTSVLLIASGAFSYTWSVNANGSTNDSVYVSPSVTTVYTVTGEGINSNGEPFISTATCTVFVNQITDVVINGNFSSTTNTVNSSLPLGVINSCADNVYVITLSMNTKCSLWPVVYDHTIGNSSGRFLVIDNGFNTGVQTAWSQTVSTVPGNSYRFSFWANCIYSQITYPFKIRTIINGLSTYTTNPITPGIWKQYIAPAYTATSNITTLSLFIESVNGTKDAYRDFGIDDISFATCGQDSLQILTGIKNSDEKDSESIILYPNPSSGIFFVNSNKAILKNINVYDNFGRLVIEKKMSKEQLVELDLTGQPKGIYLITLLLNDRLQRKRIVIQ
ncbi:MAG: T9SS type A sorting domain-containing protein [Bacteroidetes bacterium]|nr:T9SS type A sorting domain-containing protein [Bacteroidota bacterium]